MLSSVRSSSNASDCISFSEIALQGSLLTPKTAFIGVEDSPAGKKILALVETKEKELPTHKKSKVQRDGTGSLAGHIGRLLIIFCFYIQLVLRNDGLGGMTLLQSLLADTDFNGIFKTIPAYIYGVSLHYCEVSQYTE